ncbi:MAG: hypothetical protein P4M08_07415 [Oligoflexia bacterium]|nr:hypothetical protein [Oligoflexia bacterium]
MPLLFLMTSVILVPVLTYAQGGPPMVTDDPGTVENGHWEINIASLTASNYNQNLIQFPYFDINYGLGSRLQLKVETGWVIRRDHVAPAQGGADTVLAGTKFRFLDEETAGVAVATYPQFQFHHFFSSKDPELTTPGNQLILPLEFCKNIGNWAINPEIGYLYSTAASDEFLYGVVFAFEKAKPWEPLFEVHANTLLDGTGTTTLLNFGFRYTISPLMNLLVAAGHTITHTEGSSTELDTYLGLQLEL